MATIGVGSRVGPYRLVRPIGRGGMGAVWEAHDGRLDRLIALKILPPELAGSPTFRRRFLAESRMAASLDHPHIVPIFEAGEADGELYLAMRLVVGVDLGQLIESEGPLPVERTLHLLRGVADALDAAHAAGLVHRDVKPGNVLVTRTPAGEHAYLSDFGLTKRIGSVDSLTGVGQIVGSVGYVAPEQIQGRPVDARADVYSLACVLFACLAGRPPFERESDLATLWAHVNADRPRLADTQPELVPIDPVLACALQTEPAARWPSAGALISAVETGAAAPAKPGVSRALRAASTPALKAGTSLRMTVAAVGVLALAVLWPSISRFTGGLISASPPASGLPDETSTPMPSTVATPTNLTDGPAVLSLADGSQPMGIDPGTYVLADFRPTTTVTFPATSDGAPTASDEWVVTELLPDVFTFDFFRGGREEGTYSGYITGGLIQVVFTDRCLDAPTSTIGATPKELIDWIAANPYLEATDPLSVNVGSWSGLKVDVAQAPTVVGECEPPADYPAGAADRVRSAVYLFYFGDNTFWLGPEESIRLMVVDVDGRPITVLAGSSLREFDAFITTAEQVLQSFRFVGP